MANAFYCGRFPYLTGATALPTIRGRSLNNFGITISRQSLPDDPVGSTTVAFDGVPAGSEIRVQLPDSTEVAGIESCIANQSLSWQVYAPGSPNNIVRIIIVNLAYKLKDFLYTSKVGSSSIPIQMDNDPWFSNPF